jgi:Flp pilus assembly protein TadG
MLMSKVNGFAKSKRLSSAARSAGKRVRAYLRKGDEGNTIVEMALMLPILMMTMLGIYILGIMFTNYTSLTQGTGAAAEYLQSLQTEPVGTDVCGMVWTFLAGATPNTGVVPSLDSSQLTLTITLNTDSPVSGTGSIRACDTTSSDMASGVKVTVATSYPCNFVVFGHDYSRNSGGTVVACNLTAAASQLIH